MIIGCIGKVVTVIVELELMSSKKKAEEINVVLIKIVEAKTSETMILVKKKKKHLPRYRFKKT